jgi:chromosome segregation ATPase
MGREVQDSNARIRELEALNRRIQSANSEIETQQDELTQELRKLQEQSRVKEDQYTIRLAQAHGELENLKSQLKTTTEEAESLSREKQQIAEELNTLETSITQRALKKLKRDEYNYSRDRSVNNETPLALTERETPLALQDKSSSGKHGRAHRRKAGSSADDQLDSLIEKKARQKNVDDQANRLRAGNSLRRAASK